MKEGTTRRAEIARRLADVIEETQELEIRLNEKQRERQELERWLLAGEGETFAALAIPAPDTQLRRLLDLFRSAPDRTWTMREAMEALQESWSSMGRQKVTRSRLYELLRRGLLDKPSRGSYRLRKYPLAENWSNEGSAE